MYNSSFYGSMLWDLKGEKAKQLMNSWSVSVREMWDLPRNTHRTFIEPLGGPNAQTLILVLSSPSEGVIRRQPFISWKKFGVT